MSIKAMAWCCYSPTGCGKTTTLYTVLKILNTREVNISTIEDPIEYRLEGINQIQVDPTANLTFATGLRALLRQDPDYDGRRNPR